jgi:hypothetical protein
MKTDKSNIIILLLLLLLFICGLIVYLIFKRCSSISNYDGCHPNGETLLSYDNSTGEGTTGIGSALEEICCSGRKETLDLADNRQEIVCVPEKMREKYKIGPDKFGNYYYTAFQGDGTFPQPPSVIITSPSNSYIDNIDKCLHIGINYNEKSGYTGAEAVLLKNLVYGTYSFTLDFSKTPDGINFIQKDPNVIFGIFTYKRNHDATSGQGFCYPNICNEIDFIEWGKFGDKEGNATYSGDWGVQPWYKCIGEYSSTGCQMDQSGPDESRIQKIKNLNLTSDILTIKSEWYGPDKNLTFRAYSGNNFIKPVLIWHVKPDKNNVDFIPREDIETYLHFNLWCAGQPKGQCEVILSNIEIPKGCEYQEMKDYNHACEFIRESVDVITKLNKTILDWEYESRVLGKGPNYDHRCFKFDIEGGWGFYSTYLEDALKVIDLRCANENQAMLILPILYKAILGYHKKLIDFFDQMYSRIGPGDFRDIGAVRTDQLTGEILNSDGTSKVNYSNVARLGYNVKQTIIALNYEYYDRIKDMGCVF